jgi:hypothetical protein
MRSIPTAAGPRRESRSNWLSYPLSAQAVALQSSALNSTTRRVRSKNRPILAAIAYSRVARHGRSRWALFVRHRTMMPRSTGRFNLLIRDDLRSRATPRARAPSRYLNVVCLPFDSGHAINLGIGVMGQRLTHAAQQGGFIRSPRRRAAASAAEHRGRALSQF